MKRIGRIHAIVTGSLCVLALSAVPAGATLQTLGDGNSAADIETQASAGGYPVGMSRWEVDGVDHLARQWFWFRAGGMTEELPINALVLKLEGTSDTNFTGTDNHLYVKYEDADQDPTFRVEVHFGLQGGEPGSGDSDITEQIKITNLSDSPLEFHLFEYTDLDLGGVANNDTASMPNANTADQWDDTYYFSETVVTPPPAHWEIDDVPVTIDRLQTDGVATTLADATNPYGPGDVAWAFQWDFTIDANQSVQISKDKQITPEPGTLMLLAAGATLMLWRKRGRQGA